MSNTVTIDLETYDRLRNQSDAFRLLSKKEEMIWVSIDRSASNCCVYTSQYLNILTKDETLQLLANELKEVKGLLREKETELIRLNYQKANRRKWF